MFDKDTSTWVERGRGQLRLNDLRAQADSGPTVTSRIIMRTAGSLRVILNSKIFPEMTLEKPTEKNIRLTAMDGLVSKSAFDVFINQCQRRQSICKLPSGSWVHKKSSLQEILFE